MKKLQTLALAVAALAVLGGLSVGQGVQRDKRMTPPTGKQPAMGEMKVYEPAPNAPFEFDPGVYNKKVVAQAMASSIVTRKGMEFPIVAKVSSSDPTATGWASCEPGDTQTFAQNAAIDLESGDHVLKTRTYPSEPPLRKIVSPPNADWVIQSYHRVVTSAGHPYEASDSAFPAGYSYLTSGNYSSVRTTMQSFVASLNVSQKIKADLNAKLDTLISNISSYGYSVSASNGTVEHTLTLWGTGRTNTRAAHSWYHGYIDGTLICSPAYLHDQNALVTRLKTWVNGVVRMVGDPPTRTFSYE